MNPLETKRILAIQSSVCHGYVGNRSATFPLQLLGWDVDVIPTVELSNHAGYPIVKGRTLEAAQIMDLYEGVSLANPSGYECLLTGYSRGMECVKTIFQIAKLVKEKNPNAFWVLDPVLGDNGKLYVEEVILPLYRSMLPYADLITPNGFEAEVLTKMPVKSLASAYDCVQFLHKTYRIKQVVISSFLAMEGSTKNLYCFASSIESKPFYVKIPFIEGFFCGTGDLLTALLAAHIASNEFKDETDPFKKAVEVSLNSVHEVVQRTASRISSLNVKNYHPAYAELSIIKSQQSILSPSLLLSATYFE
ncbi:pyridoxine-pyridoxal-pyridoxamine kinase [Schizosaccharomyces cryophilus OY26]|uniref:pyridoxal kinase n=1 Tax=Schizosaccharomyces cryophilus (strain OY26 / ATCC MYA-4695 / CBS 11777 / NBRC 106824 / NRRL Y48691) TaxID=653667 RepID=S9W3U4_SCHCR|nr:pyridoxine-pyridoxal-pyridoxamine kinase [Schizosaccharomyces cryophilus OY26]EPY53204.1 pyridoxine-pyridoxal-pyridoxamine kinase [Schizosaccharomyces cryophilus OY26]